MSNTKHLDEVNRAIHAAGAFCPDASPDDYYMAARQALLDAEQAALLVVGLKPTPAFFDPGGRDLGVCQVRDAVKKTGIYRVFEDKPICSLAEVVRLAKDAGIEPSDTLLEWASMHPDDGLEPVRDGPLPLATGDIAFCFAGLRWETAEKWKKPLGDKPKWLKGCVVIPGVRGVSEARWNPVCIGAALVSGGHAKANNIRARFQTHPLLKPWFDAWKTYEADYFATD